MKTKAKKIIITSILFSIFSINIFAQNQNLKSYDYVNPKILDSNLRLKSGPWVYVPTTKTTCAIAGFIFDEYDKNFTEDNYEEDLYIPSIIEGLSVTELGECFFGWGPKEGCLNMHIKRIHIPDTVTFIHQGAFGWMNDGPDRRELILEGNNIAYEIYNAGLYSKKDNALITTFTESEHNDDGPNYYYDEDYIPVFKTKPGTKIICKRAFNSLANNKSIILTEGVTTIEKNAFGEEFFLITESCSFPSTVRTINLHILPNNSYISEKNPYIEFYNGGVYYKQTKTLFAVYNHSIEELIVKDGTEIVDDPYLSSFSFSYLKKIYFPDSIKKISLVYYDRKVEMNLPPNIEYLDASYPDGTLLPDSCKYYGRSNPIRVKKTNPYLKIENNMLLSKDGKILYAVYEIPENGKLIIPDGVERIEEYALSSDTLTEIVLPQSVKEYPFSLLKGYNKNVLTFNIPENANFYMNEYDYYFYSSEKNITVDEKNPFLAIKNGYLYGKQDKKLYCITLAPSQVDIIIPPEFTDLSSFSYLGKDKIESLVIVNPNTKFHGYYNYLEHEFNFYVPKGSKIDKNLSALNVNHSTYIPYKTTDNLRLRTKAGTEENSKIITTLPKGSLVRILNKKKEEVTIDGIKGHWANVQVLTQVLDKDGNEFDTEKTIKGWCFDGYLSTNTKSNK